MTKNPDIDIDGEARKLIVNGFPELEYAVKAPWTIFDLGVRGFSRHRLRRFVFCRMTREGLQIGDRFIIWSDFKDAEIRQDGPFSFSDIIPRRIWLLHLYASYIQIRNDPIFFAKTYIRHPDRDHYAAFSFSWHMNFKAGSLAVMMHVFKRAIELIGEYDSDGRFGVKRI